MKKIRNKRGLAAHLAVVMMVTAAATLMATAAGCGPRHLLTDADGPVRVCMVSDVAGIHDKSYNEQIYKASEACSLEYDLPFTYKVSDKNNDVARIAAIDSAVAEGYNVLICGGDSFAYPLSVVSKKYPDVKFVVLDMDADTLLENTVGSDYLENPEAYDVNDYYNAENTYGMVYREEVAGYLAGFTAVQLGYRKLGFLGGVSIPAVNRYGYGFVRGVGDAALMLGVLNEIQMKYAYAGQFYGSPEITAAMDIWYGNGTEVVFACGGSIYPSVAEAARKVHGKVIGVDSDQKADFDLYEENMAITSALKNVRFSVKYAIETILNGEWDEKCAGKFDKCGLLSADDPERNFVGIPLESTAWSDAYSVEDFRKLLTDIVNGTLTIPDSTDSFPAVLYEIEVRQGSIM